MELEAIGSNWKQIAQIRITKWSQTIGRYRGRPDGFVGIRLLYQGRPDVTMGARTDQVNFSYSEFKTNYENCHCEQLHWAGEKQITIYLGKP